MTTTNELAEALQRVGTAAYQAGDTGGGDGSGPQAEDAGDGASAEGATEPEAEEAVEGEYKEV